MIVAKNFPLLQICNLLYLFASAVYPGGDLGWKKETSIGQS
jgi:hypothetical protein